MLNLKTERNHDGILCTVYCTDCGLGSNVQIESQYVERWKQSGAVNPHDLQGFVRAVTGRITVTRCRHGGEREVMRAAADLGVQVQPYIE